MLFRSLGAEGIREDALEHRNEALQDGGDRRIELSMFDRVQVVDVARARDVARVGHVENGRKSLEVARDDAWAEDLFEFLEVWAELHVFVHGEIVQRVRAGAVLATDVMHFGLAYA